MKTVDEGLTMNQLAERNAEHVSTIVALEAKCAAMSLGIAYLRGEIKQHSESTHFCSRCGEADPCNTDDVCGALTQPVSDADALVAEAQVKWRAEGVDALATFAGEQYQLSAGNKALQRKWKGIVLLCTGFAAKIRKEAAK